MKEFDLDKWIQPTGGLPKLLSTQRGDVEAIGVSVGNVEKLIEAIEEKQVDITSDYTDWFRVGVALAGEYGEQGRDYFKRISRFYSGYSETEADKKYDQCLRDANPSVGIGTLFHLAKEAGVEVKGRTLEGQTPACGSVEFPEVPTELPHFSSKIDPHSFLGQIAAEGDTEAISDMLVLGSMVSLSAVMPNVSGKYDNRRVYPNLYLFVTAPPASSKGKLTACRRLIDPIQFEMDQQNADDMESYKYKLAEYQAIKRQGDAIPPEVPKNKTVFISANASSTAVYQTLNDNDGKGLTFETEGDTIAYALKSDYGNYSDGMRSAFHHEEISYMRRKENERVRIKEPKWSIVLSGTPGQVSALTPDAENGLFSRFLFLGLERDLTWRNVFAAKDNTIDDVFYQLGKRYLDMYHWLRDQPKPLEFRLTSEQEEMFNERFDKLQSEYVRLNGDGFTASVRRMGLVTYRLAMVLTVVRLLDVKLHNVPVTLCSSDEDFELAMAIAETCLAHAARVYQTLLKQPETENVVGGLSPRQQQFYDALPERFTTKEFVEIAAGLNMPEKSVNKWVGSMVSKLGILRRVKQGEYSKVGGAV